ncbi:propanediol utilization microcompartment protein PduB [Aminipila luticellarii]|uniref:Propanediol utilization microcompartment protein PduB n=1 Tax=Aminipila luticellarii TaxID=2507160 RepID=A0A410PWX1_9FIRM|nr:propanediol utilization microcompartment protein PduB [Aminipila luticellarii]QAT43404.1 propanediol utilization microcompartment protein PduB [Aminipila luticellarii]
MEGDLLKKIMEAVEDAGGRDEKAVGPSEASNQCELPEFVGAGIGDTVGLVIANLDASLREKINLDPKYRSIGIVSSRTGGAPHVMSADTAVKATNTIIASVEFARDTKGGAGHGSTIIFASEDVSDSRRAVEVMLDELDENFGNVYGCDAGHIELHYTARASFALEKAWGAPIGKAFGITVGAPPAVGMLMADVALKTANVDIVTYASPSSGTCYSSEIIITFTGDAGAVKQAVLQAREAGLSVLRGMGQNPLSTTSPAW